MSFRRCLSKGKEGEQFVKNLFRAAGFPLKDNDSKKYKKLKEYDLYSESIHDLKVECKHDKMSSKTGNLCVETANCKQKKPSGINATKALIWAHIVYPKNCPEEKQLLMCTTQALKDYIAETPAFRVLKACGDGNADISLFKTETMKVQSGGPFFHIENETQLTSFLQEALASS